MSEREFYIPRTQASRLLQEWFPDKRSIRPLALGRSITTSFQFGGLDVTPSKVTIILFEGIYLDVCGFDVRDPGQHTCHNSIKR